MSAGGPGRVREMTDCLADEKAFLQRNWGRKKRFATWLFHHIIIYIFRYTYVSKQLPIFLQVQLLEPVLT